MLFISVHNRVCKCTTHRSIFHNCIFVNIRLYYLFFWFIMCQNRCNTHCRNSLCIHSRMGSSLPRLLPILLGEVFFNFFFFFVFCALSFLVTDDETKLLTSTQRNINIQYKLLRVLWSRSLCEWCVCFPFRLVSF